MVALLSNCNRTSLLIRKTQTTHTRHHTEHVVVGGIHADRGGRGGTNSVVRHSEDERGVINTGQVASTRGLVLLGLEGERVHVDTNGGDVGVVLVRLHLVEVATLTDLETVVAVELEEGSHGRVLAGHALNAGDRVTRLEHRAVPPVRVVERLLALPGVDDGVIARHVRVTLHNPDELLTGVVEVELDLVGGGRDGLTASELEHINEVLVGHVGELTTLISVEVDVIHVEGGSDEALGIDTVTDGVGVGEGRGVVPAEVAEVVELEVDAHLVVLEGDEGEGKTRVAAEPELEGDVEGVLRGAVADDLRGVGLTANAVGITADTTLLDDVGELGDVTNHLGVTGLLAGLLGELVPDLEPVTVVLVNALTTDLKLNGADKVVANPVEPAELSTRTVSGGDNDRGESGLEVHTVDEITVALDGTGHLLGEVGGTVEGVLNGLHSEVRVTTVHNLPESDLGVTREVDILSAIGDELHKTTTCHLLYPGMRKNFGADAVSVRFNVFFYS